MHSTYGHLESPYNLTCISLNCGRKPEHPEGTHIDMRENMQTPHKRLCLNPESSCYRATELPTASLCCPAWFPFLLISLVTPNWTHRRASGINPLIFLSTSWAPSQKRFSIIWSRKYVLSWFKLDLFSLMRHMKMLTIHQFFKIIKVSPLWPNRSQLSDFILTF